MEKRARDFTYLLRGWNAPYATDQVIKVYDAVSSEQQMKYIYQWIDRYVNESYCPDDVVDQTEIALDDTYALSTRFLPIDVPETKEPFYNIFHELLDKYYKKHMSDGKKLGSVKRAFKENLNRIYGIKDNTFDAIRKGKYKSVTKEILYRIFFALELDYIDAKRLLESLGADFKRDEKFDVVIEAILKCDSPRRFIICEVNDTLNRHGLPNLF